MVAASIFAARWTLLPRYIAISNGTTSLRSRCMPDLSCFVKRAKCADTQTLITPGYHNLVSSSRILLLYTSLFSSQHFPTLPSPLFTLFSRHLQSVPFVVSSFIFSSFNATHLVIFYCIIFSFLSYSYFFWSYSYFPRICHSIPPHHDLYSPLITS